MIREALQSTQEHAVFLNLFRDFLAAHSDPDNGIGLYDLYADEAPIALGGRVLRKDEVTGESFAAAHRHAGVCGIGTLPVFERLDLIAATIEAGNSLGVGWFQLVESGANREVIAACGIRREESRWRVGWSILTRAPENWSYQQGLVQALADYPWLLTDQPAIPRSSLDASYFRLYRLPDVPLEFLPGSRFGCHMSGACCKADFEIVLPQAAQTLIDAIPWEQVQPNLKGTWLPLRADGQLQLKESMSACRFLGDQGQCLIHQTLGRQPFGPCAVFPFAFAQTPAGMAVSTSAICGSVRACGGPPLVERQDTIRERLFLAKVRRTQAFRLTPSLDISWEVFSNAESVLIELLHHSHVPLHQRLYAGTQLLDALREDKAVTMNVWLEEQPDEVTHELRAELRTYLARILSWDRRAYKLLPQEFSLDLRHDALRDEPLVVAMLANVVFSKVYSYPFDLTTAHNMLILQYLLTLVMQSAFDGPLPQELWQELAALGGHGLLASLRPDSASQDLVALLGSKEFGTWMLAYPQAWSPSRLKSEVALGDVAPHTLLG